MLAAWAVICLLILVNALYVAAEFATVSVRKSQIAELAEQGNRLARRLFPRVETAAALDHYIAACQIGITWSSLVLGAYSQAKLAPPFASMLQQWAGVDPATAFSSATVTVLLVITVFQMVLGELVPKSLALQFPTQTALATVIPMELSLRLYSWFLRVLNGSGHAILKFLGLSHAGHEHVHSPEEIEFLIAESRRGGLLETDEGERLRRGLRLASRPVTEIMVPRRVIVTLDVDARAEDILNTFAENSYTRYPVYERSPDNFIGVLHTKDVATALSRSGRLPPLRSLVRPIVTVGESATTGDLLAILRKERAHQALVVSTFGVRGLVTFGDLLAELMGGISGKGRFGQPPPAPLPDGRFRLPGFLRVEDAAELLHAPLKMNAATIAGLLLNTAGHLPKPGETITVAGVQFEIERVEHQAIVSVLARPLTGVES